MPENKPTEPTTLSDPPRRHNQTLLDLGDQFASLLKPLEAILDHLIENNRIAHRSARLTTFVLWGLLVCFALASVVLLRVENATGRLMHAQAIQEQLAKRIEEGIRLTNVVAKTTQDTQRTVTEVQDVAASQPSVTVVQDDKADLKVVIQPRKKSKPGSATAVNSMASAPEVPMSASSAPPKVAVEIPVKADSPLGRQLRDSL